MNTGHVADRAVEPVQQTRDVVAIGARLAQSALRSKWVRAGTGLWILGLLVVFVIPAPVATTDDKLELYEERMLEVSAAVKRLEEIEDEWFQADIDLKAEGVRTCLY